jgi:hypothetical protein
LFLLASGCLLLITSARAENWPGWRGPTGDGVSRESNVPVQWNGNTGEHVAWKVPTPGNGHSSPIIWNDRVFLVGCAKDENERVLVSYDCKTGQQLWQRTVLTSPLETKHALNSFASSTPATDGELVYVSFLEVDGHTVPSPNIDKPRPITPGNMVIAAYDFDGNEKWLVRPGEFISAHGYCSSPVLYKNFVIINGDHDGDSYIVALDKKTGRTVWRAPRRYQTRSYVTPIIREIDGRTQMVFSGSKAIVSLDPNDGSSHWSIEGPTEQFVASMVYDDDDKLFFMTAGFPTFHVLGIRPDGSGDVTNSHVAWHSTGAKCYVPSPVVTNGYLLVADDRGTGNCFDAATGERLWQERLGSHFSSSLVTVGGLVYFTADDGGTKIVKPGPKLEVVAENQLGEFCYSSPAISNGCIYYRGEKNLICISNEPQTP